MRATSWLLPARLRLTTSRLWIQLLPKVNWSCRIAVGSTEDQLLCKVLTRRRSNLPWVLSLGRMLRGSKMRVKSEEEGSSQALLHSEKSSSIRKASIFYSKDFLSNASSGILLENLEKSTDSSHKLFLPSKNLQRCTWRGSLRMPSFVPFMPRELPFRRKISNLLWDLEEAQTLTQLLNKTISPDPCLTERGWCISQFPTDLRTSTCFNTSQMRSILIHHMSMIERLLLCINFPTKVVSTLIMSLTPTRGSDSEISKHRPECK